MSRSRRSVLGLLTAGMMGVSGCSAADDIAKGVAKAGDDAAKGADEAADGRKAADRAGDGAAAGDDVGESLGDVTFTEESDSQFDSETIEGPGQGETVNVEDLLPVYSINQTVEVDPYTYQYYEIDLLSEMDDATAPLYMEYEVIVRSGPPVDVILTTQEEFEAYRDGDRFRYLNGSSLNTTLGTEEGSIDDIQTYYFIVDNSAAGRADPEGYTIQTAEIDIDLTISDDQ